MLVERCIQEILDNVYETYDFPTVKNEENPQSAFVITDPNGKIIALRGGTGVKEGARIWIDDTLDGVIHKVALVIAYQLLFVGIGKDQLPVQFGLVLRIAEHPLLVPSPSMRAPPAPPPSPRR